MSSFSDATGTNLGRAATQGGALLTGTNLASYALSFGATLLLARLLTPHEFGQAALAIAIGELILLAAGWSLPIALVREPAESVLIAFDTALVLTAGIAATVVAAAGVVAAVLWTTGLGEIALILLAIAGGRVAGLFGNCFGAELERRLDYARVSIAQGGSVALATALALALGFAGAGVWALAVRDVATSLMAVALTVAFSRWRPRFRMSRAKAREQLVFGAQMLGSRLGEMLFHRYDNLVVGAVAGTHQLGLYNQAYVLAETGNKVYAPALMHVPLAAYARLQGQEEQTSRAFGLVTYFLSRAVIPLAVLLLTLPGELLDVLLGSAWRPAENMLRALSVYALLLPIFEHVRVLLVANGAVREVLIARVVQLAFFLPATGLLVWQWGGEGAAVAVAGGMIIGTVAIAAFATHHVAVPVRDSFAAVAAGAVAAAAVMLTAGEVDGAAARLLVGIPTLTVVYSLALLMLEWSRLLANVRVVRETFRQRAPEQVSVQPGTVQ